MRFQDRLQLLICETGVDSLVFGPWMVFFIEKFQSQSNCPVILHINATIIEDMTIVGFVFVSISRLVIICVCPKHTSECGYRYGSVPIPANFIILNLCLYPYPCPPLNTAQVESVLETHLQKEKYPFYQKPYETFWKIVHTRCPACTRKTVPIPRTPPGIFGVPQTKCKFKEPLFQAAFGGSSNCSQKLYNF